MIEKLEKLNELKLKGVITDAEFEIEKRKVLDAGSSKIQEQTSQHLSVNKDRKVRRNVINAQSGDGIAGFVFAVVSNTYYTQPITVIIYAAVGLVFSILGITKFRKGYNIGLSIAGLVISAITLLGGLLMHFELINPHIYRTLPFNR